MRALCLDGPLRGQVVEISDDRPLTASNPDGSPVFYQTDSYRLRVHRTWEIVVAHSGSLSESDFIAYVLSDRAREALAPHEPCT